jgi:hypothetical protein
MDALSAHRLERLPTQKEALTLPYKDPEKRRASAVVRTQRYRANNLEKVKAAEAARRARPEVRAATKAYNARPEVKERTKVSNVASYAANKEKVCAAAKAWKAANREKARASYAKHHYGLPHWLYPTVREHLLCDICHQPEPERIDKRTGQQLPLSIDHDHASDEIRGTLCGNCNRGLGLYRDNPALLRAAADYLDAHNTHTRYSAQIAKRLQIPINEKGQ